MATSPSPPVNDTAAGAWAGRRDGLFVASCVALVVTAMSFAIRGNVVNQLVVEFGLSKSEIGWIAGTAFWGFTLAMMVGGPLCDVLGMKTLLRLAALGHLVGIVMTIFAGSFWTLFFSTLAFGLGNGFVEAACNPLIATLFAEQKIKRLNLFHVWFPGGIALGGLAAFAVDKMGLGGPEHGWQWQMATMLPPLIVYVALFANKSFPVTERVASGVSTREMFTQCLRPAFLLFVLCMFMTAATELGPGQWIPNILTFTTGISGILYLVWINGLMAVGRTFAGQLAHRLSPMGMLLNSAFFSGLGLLLLSRANSPALAFVAATVFAVGVCFFWPTMLAIVSERFPRTGALGLAIMGGCGMLSTSFVIPLIGARYDTVTNQNLPPHLTLAEAVRLMPEAANKAQAIGGAAALQVVVYLPVILLVIFALIFVSDRARGGYRKEVLLADPSA